MTPVHPFPTYDHYDPATYVCTVAGRVDVWHDDKDVKFYLCVWGPPACEHGQTCWYVSADETHGCEDNPLFPHDLWPEIRAILQLLS